MQIYVYIIIFADQVFIDPTFFGIFVCVLCSPLWLIFVFSYIVFFSSLEVRAYLRT